MTDYEKECDRTLKLYHSLQGKLKAYQDGATLSLTVDEQVYATQMACMNPEGLAESLRIAQKEIAGLERGYRAFAKTLKMEDSWPGFGWQRLWQAFARIMHGLPADAPIEDLMLAVLFEEGPDDQRGEL